MKITFNIFKSAISGRLRRKLSRTLSGENQEKSKQKTKQYESKLFIYFIADYDFANSAG